MGNFRATVVAAMLASMPLFPWGGAAAADADGGTGNPFYIRGDIGWSFLEWSGGADDNAATIGAGVGILWHEVLRSDVRLDWSGNYETTITDLDATTLIGNTYIDIPVNIMPITPYVGAGLGWGWVDDDGGDGAGFTYSLMGGVVFDLSERWALDAGYRFRDILLDGPDFTDHSVTAGALFKF
jgi:opacity protein-like surface antigen